MPAQVAGIRFNTAEAKGMGKKRTLWAVAGVAWATGALAQTDPVSRTTWREGLLEDLAVIRQTVEQAHPDPYRYRTKAELDQLFDKAAGQLGGSMAAEEFIQAMLPVLQGIGDANTRLDPPADLQEAYGHSVPLIPVHVAVIDGRLFLDDEPKGFRSLPVACEILRINGRTAGQILERLRGAQIPEGRDTTLLDRRIEEDFPVMYRRFVEAGGRYEVEYRTAEGRTGTQEIFALTKDDMRRTYRSKGIDLQSWRLEEIPETRSAWLTLGTFGQAELDRGRINPERFLNNVMDALRKAETTTLVIDVRGAGGNGLDLAEQAFGLVARAPYRMVRSVSIRNGRVPDSYRYARPDPEFFASAGGMYAPEQDGRRELKPDDPRLAYRKPQDKAFQGKVYVVCDGATTGAAAAFVMMARRSGRARTVGEETGTNAASFCGGNTLEVTLPGSGCILHVPLMRHVPEGAYGGPADRGEMPDYQVPRRAVDLAYGKDTVREALLNLIAEMQ